MQSYDIIGDVHESLDKLTDLLRTLATPARFRAIPMVAKPSLSETSSIAALARPS